jgi:hypothetical protein
MSRSLCLEPHRETTCLCGAYRTLRAPFAETIWIKCDMIVTISTAQAAGQRPGGSASSKAGR